MRTFLLRASLYSVVATASIAIGQADARAQFVKPAVGTALTYIINGHVPNGNPYADTVVAVVASIDDTIAGQSGLVRLHEGFDDGYLALTDNYMMLSGNQVGLYERTLLQSEAGISAGFESFTLDPNSSKNITVNGTAVTAVSGTADMQGVVGGPGTGSGSASNDSLVYIPSLGVFERLSIHVTVMESGLESNRDETWTLVNIGQASAVRDDLPTKTSIELYPNPASQTAHLSGLGTDATVQVVDALGRVLLTSTSNGDSMDLSLTDFPAGAYYCVIRNAQGTVSRELVIR